MGFSDASFLSEFPQQVMYGKCHESQGAWHPQTNSVMPARRRTGRPRDFSGITRPALSRCRRAKSEFLALFRYVAFTALLGLVVEPCFSQYKPVSQLLSTSTLASITGYKFDAPRIIEAKDDVLPFGALPRLINSSACFFPISPSKPGEVAGAEGGITINSWYFGRTDAESAKEETSANLDSKFLGPYKDPSLAYPAVFAISRGLYVFKSTPGGLLILLIKAGIPGIGGSVPTLLDVHNRIALAVFGGPEKLAGVVPLDQILEREDSLKGLAGVSVLTYVNGETEGDANDLRIEMVGQLEKLGINVFPKNEPPKFPILYLNVGLRPNTIVTTTGFTTSTLSIQTYLISLDLEDLFPVGTVGGQKYVPAKTWITESYDTVASSDFDLSDKVGQRMAKFAEAYEKANLSHPAAYRAGVGGAASAATGGAVETLPARTRAVRQSPQSKALEIAGLSLAMQPIAPGTFQMGSRPGASYTGSQSPGHIETPMTSVSLTKAFWLGRTEVTQRQWKEVMGTNPSKIKGDDLPVESVPWGEAMAFCRKLTQREQAAGRLPAGYVYTLPTEAQWEYACRAGTTGDYAGNLDEMGWYSKSSGNKTHPVGLKQANAWGLHDMVRQRPGMVPRCG